MSFTVLILLVLTVLMPLLFWPWSATRGDPETAGDRAFIRPRQNVLAAVTILLSIRVIVAGRFTVPSDLRWWLALPLLFLPVPEMLRSLLRGTVPKDFSPVMSWVSGPWIWMLAYDLRVRGMQASSYGFLARFWWAPFLPVILYAWSQRLFPQWDFPWSNEPEPPPALDPATIAGENREQVLAVLRSQGVQLLGDPPQVERRAPAAPASTLGGPHFTAEVLTAVAVGAPWPAAVAALGTMAMLKSRLALVVSLAVLVGFLPVPGFLAFAGRGAIVFVAAGLATIVFLDRRWNRPTTPVRWDIWRRTLDVIRAHPWIGVGTGGFRRAVRQGVPAGEQAWMGRIHTAHSEYLERAAEWGIPGALVFTAWVAAVAWHSPPAAALALAAVAGHSFHQPAGWFLFALLGGLSG